MFGLEENVRLGVLRIEKKFSGEEESKEC